jgi:hypothetical protein
MVSMISRTLSKQAAHRGGAEDGEEAQRLTEALHIALRFLSVLCASAVKELSDIEPSKQTSEPIRL